jgi:hypothetical protein
LQEGLMRKAIGVVLILVGAGCLFYFATTGAAAAGAVEGRVGIAHSLSSLGADYPIDVAILAKGILFLLVGLGLLALPAPKHTRTSSVFFLHGAVTLLMAWVLWVGAGLESPSLSLLGAIAAGGAVYILTGFISAVLAMKEENKSMPVFLSGLLMFLGGTGWLAGTIIMGAIS